MSWSRARIGEVVSGEEERQFLVGADEEEEGDRERDGGIPGVMSNVGVLSRVDTLNGDTIGRPQHDNVSGGGLSAKAGIILVGFPLL